MNGVATRSEEERLREALRRVREWVASLTDADMDEIVADGGITTGMVIRQEATEQLRRIDRALTAQADASSLTTFA